MVSKRDFLKFTGGVGMTGVAQISGISSAFGQNFPNRPLRMISPFAPGGGTDLVGRTLAEGMAKDLGQSIVYENKPGAGTVIGSDIVAKSIGDGYTLLLTTSGHAINQSLVKNLPFNIDTSFTNIARICKGPMMLVSRPDSPYQSIQNIIAYAKNNPSKLTYGSSGNGSAVHLAAELFKLMAGIDLTHVPYKGAGPAFTDLLGGQLDFVFATVAGVGKFVEAGKMRAIAVTSQTRSASWPLVPTIAQSGVPGYETEVWYALFGSPGIPEPIVERLNLAAKNAANSPNFLARIEKEGIVVAVSSPAELTKLVQSEKERWRKVIAQGKITID